MMFCDLNFAFLFATLGFALFCSDVRAYIQHPAVLAASEAHQKERMGVTAFFAQLSQCESTF